MRSYGKNVYQWNYSVEERNDDAREKGSAKEGMLPSAQVEYWF